MFNINLLEVLGVSIRPIGITSCTQSWPQLFKRYWINLHQLDSAIILVFPISTACNLMEDAIQLLNNWGLGCIGKIEMLPILPICLSAHLKRY